MNLEVGWRSCAAFEDDALSNPEEFLWRDDAINIYVVAELEGVGGICSFSYDPRHENIIVITNGIFENIQKQRVVGSTRSGTI